MSGKRKSAAQIRSAAQADTLASLYEAYHRRGCSGSLYDIVIEAFGVDVADTAYSEGERRAVNESEAVRQDQSRKLWAEAEAWDFATQ